MLMLSNNVSIADDDIDWQAIRAQGSGGQNVNKVSSAIHLRFDIAASSLPDFYKERLQALSDRRITADGVIVIKAQRFRRQDKNLADAKERLRRLILDAVRVQKKRRATAPSRAAKRRRTDNKTHRGRVKSLRGRVE